MRSLVAMAWVVCGVLSCWPAAAATVKPGPVAPVHTMVRITPGQGERVWVLPWGSTTPTTVDVVEAKDGDLVFVGPPGVYAILWLSPNGQGQTFVTIRDGGPVPPVPPGPNPPGPVPPGPGPSPVNPDHRPDGFAGEVFDQAAKIGDKATALRLATACQNVLSAIAAGGMNRDQAAAALIEQVNNTQPPVAWKPFADWFTSMGSTRAATLPQMRQFLADCIEGLEAVAK